MIGMMAGLAGAAGGAGAGAAAAGGSLLGSLGSGALGIGKALLPVLGGSLGGMLGGSTEDSKFDPIAINSGVGGINFSGGAANTTLDPRLQALSDQLLGQAGGLFGQLQNNQSIAADDLFAQAMAMAAPEQARARASNASQLFAQGQLGSTGGGLQTQGLEQGIFNANNQLAMQAIFDAQTLQDQLLNRGLAAQGGAVQLEQLPLGLINSALAGGAYQAQDARFNAGQGTTQNANMGGLISAGAKGLFGEGGLFNKG